MTTTELAERVVAGDRRALAKAVTLVESTRPDQMAAAEVLLARLAQTGRQALRLGITGTPGVGKSTFIEAFGKRLTSENLKVAVLAVDPSSARTGGAILGDKTRMPELARDPLAYIRPSPSRAALGGIAESTRSVIAVCEGAGFDVVIVETVGVGQSETLVADLTDIFLLLIAPGGGDELQGVKRGIMEVADLIVVNKADGNREDQAKITAADYKNALSLLRRGPGRPDGYPAVLTASSLDARGIRDIWSSIKTLADWQRTSGWAHRNRGEQHRKAFEIALKASLERHLFSMPGIAKSRARLLEEVIAGRIRPSAAAETLLKELQTEG